MAEPKIILTRVPENAAPTVLIVDDDVLVRTMVADFLRLEGFKVLEAAGVAEAKQALSMDDAALDFVVTDIHMPGEENGLDLVRHIRQHHPRIPVLVISGNPGHSNLHDERFLAKPFNLTQLLSVVRTVLFQQRGFDPKAV